MKNIYEMKKYNGWKLGIVKIVDALLVELDVDHLNILFDHQENIILYLSVDFNSIQIRLKICKIKVFFLTTYDL